MYSLIKLRLLVRKYKNWLKFRELQEKRLQINFIIILMIKAKVQQISNQKIKKN